MARNYPRFIYSDPFIVHLKAPRMVCRIDQGEDHFKIEILEIFDQASTSEAEKVISSMRRWAIAKTSLHILK